tara:strand:- start:334 stop:588 length:255 start_codon:yes stop_codon:yes gene_type:complete
MAKEKKHTGMSEQMDDHVFSILKVLNSIDSHLASMVYHQNPSRGFGASIEKAVAQPYVSESKKIEDKIEKLVIEELRKLNEENK